MSDTAILILKIAAAIAACGVFFWLLTVFVASICAFRATFVRTSPDKWEREATDRVDEKLEMFEFGKKWRKEHLDRMSEVCVSRDGIDLFGEYYDFGSDRCVMILLGRSECFYDAFFFADPYVRRGFSVLAVDSRAHGKSGGVYHTFGFEESGDYLVWAKYICERFGVRHIVLHGICVGASAGLFALTSPDCPPYIDALVGEGMHTRLFEPTKNHIRERKKPVHPLIELMDLWMILCTHHSMRKGPVDFIDRYEKPLLMLHSAEDTYSLPEKARALFEKCPSENKRFVLLPKGKHSLCRINNKEQYDGAVDSFICDLYPELTKEEPK